MHRPLRFGVHTPLQHTSPDELIELWQRIESAGFDWISVWDHLYAVTPDGRGSVDNLDSVAMHAALAMATTRVRCSCLVYSVGFRSAAVLASSLATIDHLSHGRAVLALGAGYLRSEYDAFGLELEAPGRRVDQLAETLTAVRALFGGDPVDVDGEYVQFHGAVCAPRPVQEHLPIWIGGGGEQRTIPLAAQLADGWNVPMASPEDFARKTELLRNRTEAAGRPRDAVEASVSIGFCPDESLIPERFGPRWPTLRPAICTGSTDQMTDTIGRYRDAGADWINLSLRAPLGVTGDGSAAVADQLDAFASQVMAALR
jgi:probable F420-dependent oxidoreductase